MNKQIFLSLALIGLVSFSAVYATGEQPKPVGGTEVVNAPVVVAEPVKTESVKSEVQGNKEEVKPSRLRSALNSAQEKLGSIKNNPGKTAGVVAFVVALVATHKIMIIKCPWYKNLINGTDEDTESNNVPWARA